MTQKKTLQKEGSGSAGLVPGSAGAGFCSCDFTLTSFRSLSGRLGLS